MLKKIINKRTEEFKKSFPNFQISKKTESLYVTIGNYESNKSVVHNGRSITKSTLFNLGKKLIGQRKSLRLSIF